MIEASVQGRNFAVVLRGLATLDARVLQAAGKGMARGLEYAVGYIRRRKLLGQVLNRRTGQLIKSLEQRVDVLAEGVVGRVGSNLPYAAVHEFGYQGTQQVRAHTRALGAIFQRRGGPALTGRAAAQRLRTGSVAFGQVKAHSRRVNFKERSFARTGIQESLPQILNEIRKEIATIKPEGSP